VRGKKEEKSSSADDGEGKRRSPLPRKRGKRRRFRFADDRGRRGIHPSSILSSRRGCSIRKKRVKSFLFTRWGKKKKEGGLDRFRKLTQKGKKTQTPHLSRLVAEDRGKKGEGRERGCGWSGKKKKQSSPNPGGGKGEGRLISRRWGRGEGWSCPSVEFSERETQPHSRGSSSGEKGGSSRKKRGKGLSHYSRTGLRR